MESHGADPPLLPIPEHLSDLDQLARVRQVEFPHPDRVDTGERSLGVVAVDASHRLLLALAAVLFPGGLLGDADLSADLLPRVALAAEERDDLCFLGVEGVVGALPVAAELAKVIEQRLIHRNSLASA
jgi:hypothetical protein